MIKSTHPQPPPSEELCTFLRKEIGLTAKELDLGIRHSQAEHAPLAIVLWSFGLINLSQYQQILSWQYDN